MKKLISKVLVFTMLFSLMPAGILAADTVEIGDFTYSITEEGAVLTQYNQNAQGEVTIPETITHEGEDYSVIGIGNDAFKGKSLTRVIIPETVVSIGNNTFQNCRQLVSVTIPNSVTSIGNFAFGGTWALSSVVLSENLTSISTSLFNGSRSLKTIVIPESVTSIGMNAFSGCTALESIVLPESLTSIGQNAFFNCSSLTDIKIPKGVSNIVTGTFQNCSNLNKVILEKDVSSIHVQAFTGAISLKEIEAVSDNDTYSSVDGILYNKEKDIIIKYPQGREESSFEIPQQVISIHPYAFQDSIHLTRIEIPENVTAIGANTFNGCSNLTEITLPKNITSIENYLFAGCTSLSSIELPQGVTSIGNYAFNGNTSLSTVLLPDTLVSIGNDAFRGNSSLKGIDLPDGLETIGNNAFMNSTGLEKADIPESVISIGNTAFRNAAALKEIIIRNKETTIGNNAFMDIPNLTIGGIKGSTAEEYANNNFISFKEIFTGSLTLQAGTEENAPDLDTIRISVDNQLEPTDGDITLYYAEDNEGSKTAEKIIEENNQMEENDEKYIAKNLSANTQYAFVAVSSKTDFIDEKSPVVRVTTADPVTLLIEDIDALPFLEEITLADESVIISLLERYNELDSSQQVGVSNYEDLQKAKDKIDAMKADQEAANEMMDLIEALPSPITWEDRYQVAAVWEKYEQDLTEGQKTLVENFHVLRAAMDIIEELEGYDAEAQPVIAMIDNLASIDSITLEDEGQVQSVRSAYNELSQGAKEFVINKDKLIEAETKISSLKDDKSAAEHVIELIETLPAPGDITLDNINLVEAARDAYDILTPERKELIDQETLDKLMAAEAAAGQLKADKAAADQVISKIHAIPEQVSLEDEGKIAEARAAYHELSEGQKELISQEIADKLKAAEDRLEELKEAKAQADTVIEAIDQLPEEITLEDKEAAAAARKAYDALSDDEKAFVSNFAKLKAVGEKITQLEADRAAADEVKRLIDQLPDNIALSDKVDVESAVAAYEALTPEQKALVGNANKLQDAKAQIAQLEEEQKEEEDKKEEDGDEDEQDEDTGKDSMEDEDKVSPEDSENTKTGDEFSPIWWISLTLLTGGLLLIVRKRRTQV